MSKKDKKNNSKELNKTTSNNFDCHCHEHDEFEDTTADCDCHKVDCKSCRKNNTSNKDLL